MAKFKARFSDAERAELLAKSQRCIWLQEGRSGMAYLDHRHLSKQVIKEFGLGFVPHDVCHQLAGRIIFPLYDPSGNLVTLMSRHIGNGDSRLPDHWHEHYEKSFHLYAIDKAKDYMRKWGFVVVCEGQIDALQFHNNGVKNVVALCCTNLSDVQMALIHRYCDEIILVLDSDPNRAGQSGTEKIMQKVLPKGYAMCDSFGELERVAVGTGLAYKISPVFLPDDMDPDEHIQAHGIQKIKSLVLEPLMKMRGRQCQLISTS